MLTGVLSLVVLALATGCSDTLGDADPTPKPSAAAPAVSARPSGALQKCIFIVLDAANANHFSYYGYERETTPAFDALAADGVAFVAAQSTSPNTLTSTRTYLTGRHLPKPLPGSAYSFYRVPKDAHTVAGAFKAKGFETLGLSQNPNVSVNFNFDIGFSRFKRYQSRGTVQTPDGRAFDQPAEAMFEDAKTWIGERKDGAWFCYLHLLRPHNPYVSPEPYLSRWNDAGIKTVDVDGERFMAETIWFAHANQANLSPEDTQYLIDMYDGNLAFVDALMGEFIEWLKAEGLFESTLVVVSSDHGEAFMEHGQFAHSTTVYNEMIHVPLAFSVPDAAAFKRGTVDTPVDLVDLFPTLAELFDLSPESELHGRSMVPLLRGESRTHKSHLVARRDDLLEVAVRMGMDKVIFRRPGLDAPFDVAEVYDLQADPMEQVNLRSHDESRDVIARAENALKAFEAMHWQEDASRQDGPPRVKEDVLEELKSLGYLGDE